jgi:O6-methylguanine-DNA--protein-cysteine methyltransferase
MNDEPEEGLSQYEQERKARIASNRRLIQSLGLHDVADAARGAAAAQQKRRREGRAEGGARRRSTRGLEQRARTLKSEAEEDSVAASRDGAASQGVRNIVGRYSAAILLEQSARKFLESEEEDEDSVAASRDSAVSTSWKAHGAEGAARRPRTVQPWLPADDDTSFVAKEDTPACKRAAKMSHRLNGKQIFFTGALQMKRYDAKTKAEAAGATVTDSLSADLDILVCGSGSVANKKKFYEDQKKAFPGIEVWTEPQFTSALSGGSSSNGKKRAAESTASFGFAAAKTANRTKESEEESNTSMREAKMSLSPPPSHPPTTKGSEQESATTGSAASGVCGVRPLVFEDAARAAGSSKDFARRVLQVVKAIPVGRVASYGQCAALAGRPNNARQVGKLLALGLAAGGEVPVEF